MLARLGDAVPSRARATIIEGGPRESGTRGRGSQLREPGMSRTWARSNQVSLGRKNAKGFVFSLFFFLFKGAWRGVSAGGECSRADGRGVEIGEPGWRLGSFGRRKSRKDLLPQLLHG